MATLSLQKMFEQHDKDDKAFQQKTDRSTAEMMIFKAETEGSLSDIHRRLDNLPETISAQITRMLRWVGVIGLISILGLAAAWGKLNNQVDTNKQDIENLRTSAVITKYDLQAAVTQAVTEAQKK